MKTVAVFDSGVGGLSILRALHRHIPFVHWVYVADSAFAPYGGRSASEVQERSTSIAGWLQALYQPDALVVACNTATAWAIDNLRRDHPSLPIVGVEPALKPAAQQTRTAHVGVLATSGTLASPRFAALLRSVRAQSPSNLRISCQPCPGLADAIERAEEPAVRELCNIHAQALLAQADALQPIDTAVLGCTHYPFARHHWQEAFGPAVTILDNAPAIARRTSDVLASGDGSAWPATGRASGATLLASSNVSALALAFVRWIPDLPVYTARQLPLA